MSNRTKYVNIQKDGETAQVMPAAVKVWERNGWTVVDDGSSETAAHEEQHQAEVQHQLSLLDDQNKE